MSVTWAVRSRQNHSNVVFGEPATDSLKDGPLTDCMWRHGAESPRQSLIQPRNLPWSMRSCYANPLHCSVKYCTSPCTSSEQSKTFFLTFDPSLPRDTRFGIGCCHGNTTAYSGNVPVLDPLLRKR